MTTRLFIITSHLSPRILVCSSTHAPMVLLCRLSREKTVLSDKAVWRMDGHMSRTSCRRSSRYDSCSSMIIPLTISSHPDSLHRILLHQSCKVPKHSCHGRRVQCKEFIAHSASKRLLMTFSGTEGGRFSLRLLLLAATLWTLLLTQTNNNSRIYPTVVLSWPQFLHGSLL